MPLLTGEILPGGAIIDVLVEVSPARRQRLEEAGFPVPAPVPLRVAIDTGSHITGFMPEVFQQLGIPHFSVVPIRTPSTTATSPHLCELFDVGLTIVHLSASRRIESVHAIASPDFSGDSTVQGIIGRDVLDLFVFCYDGPQGRFSLSF